MKVAIITRHAIINYGSLLQAIATQKIVEEFGHSCEIIDYIRKDETYSEVEKTILKSKNIWNRSWIKKIIYLFIRQLGSIIAGRKFEKMRMEHLNLSRRYSTLDEICANKPDADVYMTGSDQVWGPVADGNFDSTYCLSFANEKDKKIAYAASFGRTNMTESSEKYYANWLTKYAHIAVREKSAVIFLEKLGINSLQVLDPTLLLDSSYWQKYLKPIKEKKYILIYQIHNDKKLGEYAKKVAEDMGAELIRISSSLHQIIREGKFVYAPDLGIFLSYIKNAECIITDSFHGTAFAINFNTNFVEVLPNNTTGTRNMSILELTGLTERILMQSENVNLANEKINYTHANSVLSVERNKSINILQHIIQK